MDSVREKYFQRLKAEKTIANKNTYQANHKKIRSISSNITDKELYKLKGRKNPLNRMSIDSQMLKYLENRIKETTSLDKGFQRAQSTKIVNSHSVFINTLKVQRRKNHKILLDLNRIQTMMDYNIKNTKSGISLKPCNLIHKHNNI